MSTMLRKRIFSIKRRAMLKTIGNMSSQHVKSEDMLRIVLSLDLLFILKIRLRSIVDIIRCTTNRYGEEGRKLYLYNLYKYICIYREVFVLISSIQIRHTYFF